MFFGLRFWLGPGFSSSLLYSILRSLHPVLGLGFGLVIVLELLVLLEGLSSLLEQQA